MSHLTHLLDQVTSKPKIKLKRVIFFPTIKLHSSTNYCQNVNKKLTNIFHNLKNQKIIHKKQENKPNGEV